MEPAATAPCLPPPDHGSRAVAEVAFRPALSGRRSSRPRGGGPPARPGGRRGPGAADAGRPAVGGADRQLLRPVADPAGLESHVPVVERFPDFDDNLRQALRRETELLFASLVVEDGSVLDLLTADYTFVNERARAPLRHPGRLGQPVPPRRPRRGARRPAGAARQGRHPDGAVAARPHVTGAAGQVGAAELAGRPAPRPAARHARPAAAGRRSAESLPGVTGADHFVAAAYLCAQNPKKTTGRTSAPAPPSTSSSRGASARTPCCPRSSSRSKTPAPTRARGRSRAGDDQRHHPPDGRVRHRLGRGRDLRVVRG